MNLCYSDMKLFDGKLDAILAGVTRLEGRDDAELAALRQEIVDLINAASMEQAEKDALNAKIAAVLAKSATVEDKVRSVIPAIP